MCTLPGQSVHKWILKNYVTYLLPLLTLTSISCQQESTTSIDADFEALNQNQLALEERTAGVFGGSSKKKILPIETNKAELRVNASEILMKFSPEGSISLTPKALGLPQTWENIQQIHLQIHAKHAGELFFHVYGPRTRSTDTLNLQSGTNVFSIACDELPIMGGTTIEPLYLRWVSPLAQTISLRALRVKKGTSQPVLVDRWGQRASIAYPHKITSLETLKNTDEEKTFLKALTVPKDLDAFGGFTNTGMTFAKKGFFYTTFHQDRWWLVTPEGNPFYSLGLNGVRIKSFRGNADVTRVQGREAIFEEIPEVSECPECFRENQKYFSFYCWNVVRKYPSFQTWRDHTYQRLTKIGFNTIGNWSDTLFYQSPKLPYTYTLDTRKDTSLRMANGLPDVFHPAWEKHLFAEFSEISTFKNDPYMLGYFVDNEIHWRSLTALDTSSHTCKALQSLPESKQKQVFAEKYFSTIQKVLNTYDPNHLYLGCRFTRNFQGMEEIARTAGKYIDVLSVNIYSAYPIREETDAWYEAAQKPILIGEHHIPPTTQKQLLPHYPSFAEPQRSQMIQQYVTTWMHYPYALGSHWYQFKDQEVAGRGDGGENQPIGLVSISDQLNYPVAKVYSVIAKNIRDYYHMKKSSSQVLVSEEGN